MISKEKRASAYRAAAEELSHSCWGDLVKDGYDAEVAECIEEEIIPELRRKADRLAAPKGAE